MVFIKINNLKVDMVIKNYKELCQLIEVKPKTGNSKKAQIKWFKEHFTYKKEGNKIIIDEILTTKTQPKPLRGGSNNNIPYKENIEKLILDILAQNNNKGKIFLSRNKFFYALEMVNVNYLDTYGRLDKWSKHLDIDEYIMREWIDTAGGVLERSVESALSSLRDKALIIWSKEMTICKLVEVESSEVIDQQVKRDEYGEETVRYIMKKHMRDEVREANDEEKKQVLRTEKDILDQIGCVDKSEVIKKGMWQDFKIKLDSILLNKYRIKYHFQSYKILSNPEHIQREFRKRYLLDSDTRKEEKIITNSSVMDRLEENANSRYKNAIKQLEDSNIIIYQDEKIKNRTKDTYINNNVKINKALIDINAPDVRKTVRKIKIE